MAHDDLTSEDVEAAVLTGRLARRYTRDPRGTRYKVIGRSTGGGEMCVVGRFLPSGTLLIITVFSLEDSNEQYQE